MVYPDAAGPTVSTGRDWVSTRHATHTTTYGITQSTYFTYLLTYLFPRYRTCKMRSYLTSSTPLFLSLSSLTFLLSTPSLHPAGWVGMCPKTTLVFVQQNNTHTPITKYLPIYIHPSSPPSPPPVATFSSSPSPSPSPQNGLRATSDDYYTVIFAIGVTLPPPPSSPSPSPP